MTIRDALLQLFTPAAVAAARAVVIDAQPAPAATKWTFADTYVNLLAGLGVHGRDKAASGTHQFRYYTQVELDAAFRSDWIARKVVECPAKDATREWRAWQAKNADIEKIEEVEKKLRVQKKLYDGLMLSRLYGGAAIIIGANQGLPEEELRIDKIKQGDLKFLHVLSRYQMHTGPVITDPLSEFFGEPEYFTLHNSGHTGQLVTTNPQAKPTEMTIPGQKIHPSRVVMLRGMFIPSGTQAQALPDDPFWGDSVLQIVMEAVQACGLVVSSIQSLVTESKLDIIKIPELSRHLSSDEYRGRLTTRFTFANSAKSIINTLLLDKEEEWERVNAQFAGLPDILKLYLLIASGAADIPATRMLGQSSAGLNATGEGDIRNYYDRIASDQNNDLSPVLDRLDEVIIRSATGNRDKSIFYEWRPLWQQTEEEKSTVAANKAKVFQIDATVGIIDPEALRVGRQNQLIEDGTYPGLEQALEAQDLLGVESMSTPEEQEEERLAKQEGELELQTSFLPPDKRPGAPPKKKVQDDFNPNQPRAPAGSPGGEGGQWVKGGGSGASLATAAVKTVQGGSGTLARDLLDQSTKNEETFEEVMSGMPPQVHDKIKAVTAEIEALPVTIALVDQGGHCNPDETYTESRQQIHREIMAKTFSDEAIAKARPKAGEKPTLLIVGGRPASGKSTAVATLPEAKNYINLNADLIQESLPGYKPELAAIYHREAADLVHQLEKRGKELGLNILYDGTLSNKVTIEGRVERYRDAGYEIDGVFVHVPPAEATKRAAVRFMRGDRYVPLDYVYESRTNEDTFDAVSRYMRSWKIFTNTDKTRLYAQGGRVIGAHVDAYLEGVIADSALVPADMQTVIKTKDGTLLEPEDFFGDFPDGNSDHRYSTETLAFFKSLGATKSKDEFDPNQPRAPAGTPEGGQWVATGFISGGGSSEASNAISKIFGTVGFQYKGKLYKLLTQPDNIYTSTGASNKDITDLYGGQQKLAELVQGHSDAIHSYTSNSTPLNKSLRTPQQGYSQSNYSSMIAKLDKMFAETDQARQLEDVVLFRGVGSTGWQDFVDQNPQVGGHIYDLGFAGNSAKISTAKSFGQGGKTVVEVLLPKGSNTFPLITGGHPGESEILIARNAKYKVLAWDPANGRIRLLYMGTAPEEEMKAKKAAIFKYQAEQEEKAKAIEAQKAIEAAKLAAAQAELKEQAEQAAKLEKDNVMMLLATTNKPPMVVLPGDITLISIPKGNSQHQYQLVYLGGAKPEIVGVSRKGYNQPVTFFPHDGSDPKVFTFTENFKAYVKTTYGPDSIKKPNPLLPLQAAQIEMLTPIKPDFKVKPGEGGILEPDEVTAEETASFVAKTQTGEDVAQMVPYYEAKMSSTSSLPYAHSAMKIAEALPYKEVPTKTVASVENKPGSTWRQVKINGKTIGIVSLVQGKGAYLKLNKGGIIRWKSIRALEHHIKKQGPLLPLLLKHQ